MNEDVSIPSLQWGRIAQRGVIAAHAMHGVPEGDPYEWMALMPCAISTKRQIVHAQAHALDREPVDYVIPLDVWLDMQNLVVKVFDVESLIVD